MVCDSFESDTTNATSKMAETKCMKVLVAVDESEGSFYSLRWALDTLFANVGPVGAHQVTGTVGRPSTDLLLLHVQQPFHQYTIPAGPGSAVYATTSMVESIRKGQEQNTNNLLTRAKKLCSEKGVIAKTLIMDGDPKEMICQAAEQIRSDLVVVGSRGLSTFKRAFLGSVSDYVAHHAPCPVLIVKPPKHNH